GRDMGAELDVGDGGEVGMLQAGFNEMVGGLRERALLHDLFGRHVGAGVARRALEEGTALGGEQRAITVFFVDLIGSTGLAEAWSAPEVVALLNRFFGAVVSAVSTEGGWGRDIAVGARGRGAVAGRARPRPGLRARPRPRQLTKENGGDERLGGELERLRGPRRLALAPQVLAAHLFGGGTLRPPLEHR